MVGRSYGQLTSDAVTALEESLPSGSRVLVGLAFSERYDGFEVDCERAEAALQAEAGLSTWPELDHFITPDSDGQPIAWVSYLSSPAWWTFILVIMGGIFLLPILTAIPMWIADLIFPGFTELLTLGIIMFVMFLVIRPMTKGLTEGEEK